MPSLKKQSCPTCGQSVNERSITLYKGMVTTLWQVFQWCEQKHRHEFTKQDIKHLITSDVVSSTFAYWRWFGGLAYNPDGIKGHYGLNMDRCADFFAGKLRIPTVLWKNPLKKGDEMIRPDEYRYIHEVPSLAGFLDVNNNYIAKYRNPQGQLF